MVQAEAAGIEPDTRMNPILLKLTTDVGSQVIVNGQVRGNMQAMEYFRRKRDYIPAVLEAYNSLASEYDVIVIEGAGSPAEINLKQDDIVNMGLAKLVDGLIAGSDIWDSPMPKIHTTKAANYENDAYIVTQMRNAMHHILYTVVNSNAMNGWASTDTLKTITPWWQTAIYALIAVLAVLTILCAWQLSKALKAKKSMVDTAPAADQK